MDIKTTQQKNTPRFKVIKGYLTLKMVDESTGEVIREGGFTEDPEYGELYAVLDTQTKKIVDGSFKPIRAYRLAQQYEAGKPVLAPISDLNPRLSTVTLRENGKTITHKHPYDPNVLHQILTLNREKPPKFDLSSIPVKSLKREVK